MNDGKYFNKRSTNWFSAIAVKLHCPSILFKNEKKKIEEDEVTDIVHVCEKPNP